MQAALRVVAEDKEPLTTAFWSSGGNLLTGLDDDTLLAIAMFLPTAIDVLRFGLTCTRFSTRCVGGGAAAALSAAVAVAAAAAPAVAGSAGTEMWSLASEAARRWIAACSASQRAWVPLRPGDSWLRLMHELQGLRVPQFSRAHDSVTLSEGGAVASADAAQDDYRCAASKPMRAGRHFARFTLLSDDTDKEDVHPFVGLIRPGWNVRGTEANVMYGPCDVEGHCFYDTLEGRRRPGPVEWDGMERGDGREIGMLLDLDRGTLGVFANGERLGTIATGLSGEYCWAVAVQGLSQGAYDDEDCRPDSVRIGTLNSVRVVDQIADEFEKGDAIWPREMVRVYREATTS